MLIEWKGGNGPIASRLVITINKLAVLSMIITWHPGTKTTFM